jgi:hypothetical protein
VSHFKRVLLGALLACAAPSARAGVGRAVEIAPPVESASFKTGSAPAITLQLSPVNSLSPLGLTPALAPAPLAPTLLAPSILTAKPAPVAAAPVPAAAAPAKPVDALRATGSALTRAAPASSESGQVLQGLFDGGGPKESPASAVDGSLAGARAPTLAPATPRPARRMPGGVKRAFQNSAVLGGGMAGLSGALYAWTQSLVSAPSPAQFALLAAPLLLIPFHFALVSGFWAGRYYSYPKLSPAAKNAFEAAWRAAAVAYPVAALAMIAAWFQIIGSNPAVLGVMGLPALVALGEVTHHFIYRVVPERAQDKGKPLTDWRSRIGGNIGQQLRRMRRKP